MRSLGKELLAPLLVLGFFLGGISWWTNGFTTFTVFSNTLKAAGSLPRHFPPFHFLDQDGKEFSLEQRHGAVLVNFVYLDCPSVCHWVNNRLEGIYHELQGDLIPSRLELVTISFNLKDDDLPKIKAYATQFCGSDGANSWTFARPKVANSSELDRLLHQMGVWAVPLPGSGIINHSVYLFLVSPRHEIIRVYDPAREEDEAIVADLRLCLEPGGSHF